MTSLAHMNQLVAVSLEDPKCQDLLRSMDPIKVKASFHLVDEVGTIKSGGEALPNLVKAITGITVPSRLTEAHTFRRMSSILYAAFARLKGSACRTWQ